MKKLIKLSFFFSFLMLFVACGDDDLEPTLALDKDLSTGINNAGDLQSVLNSAYDRMSSSGYYGRNQIVMGDVRTDNAYSTLNSGRFSDSDMEYSTTGSGPWTTIYGVIAICNIVIGVDGASLEGDQGLINHTIGQAHAIRALAHFDLLQDYGQHFVTGQGGAGALGVPYVKTYKDPANLTPARDTAASNLGDIVADLQGAIGLMNDAYNVSTSYMTKMGAYAILARAALYGGAADSSLFATAGSAAEWVINNGTASPSSASGFRATYYTDNAVNSIFEMAMSGTDSRGINGMAYILRGTSYGDVRILTGDGPGEDLYDIFAADAATDVRFTKNRMIGLAQGLPSVLGKYPSMDGSDNVTIFRVEEMHLIAAEAALRAGNSSKALTYLNNVPALRGGSLYTEATLSNILKERRKELYMEAPGRFYDLARTGQDMPLIDSLLQLNDDKDGTPPKFGSYRYAYPIYIAELNANPNIVQNAGY